jgi:hypothetical protein
LFLVSKEIIESDKLQSFRDMIFVKVILTAAIYPQVALADENNNYRVRCSFHFSSIT